LCKKKLQGEGVKWTAPPPSRSRVKLSMRGSAEATNLKPKVLPLDKTVKKTIYFNFYKTRDG